MNLTNCCASYPCCRCVLGSRHQRRWKQRQSDDCYPVSIWVELGHDTEEHRTLESMLSTAPYLVEKKKSLHYTGMFCWNPEFSVIHSRDWWDGNLRTGVYKTPLEVLSLGYRSEDPRDMVLLTTGCQTELGTGWQKGAEFMGRIGPR